MAIEKNSPIVIERAGNGFVVRPLGEKEYAQWLADILVFNDLGYASQARDYGSNTSLTVFVASHFNEPTPEPKP